MFNLLPNDLKDAIRSEYNYRKVVVVLVFTVFILILVFAMILPTWFSSIYKEREVAIQAEKMNNYLSTLNIGPTTEFIKALNQKMQVLNLVLEYPRFNPLLDNILAQKIPGIQLEEFSYKAVSSSTATISIRGTANTRDNLVSFSKKIEGTSVFKTVDLPISNLAKDKNIDFSMTLTVSPKTK